MNQALINVLIVMGAVGLIMWNFLQGIENKKKEEALRKKNKTRKKKKKKEKDKPWIVLPNPIMLLVYAIGIIYMISLFYGLAMFANIIGPFGLIFLFLWLVSMNKNKE
ncbi:hypothetical protein N9L67_00850 [Candidatus Pelagibacter bacterium]|nr:hypothetical protein [Candidatus Pelagibacter bacterium]